MEKQQFTTIKDIIFTTIKSATKKAQQLKNDFDYYSRACEVCEIYDIYERPSASKRYAFNKWRNVCNEHGWCLYAGGHNSDCFTLYIDMNNGLIAKITKDNNYLLSL